MKFLHGNKNVAVLALLLTVLGLGADSVVGSEVFAIRLFPSSGLDESGQPISLRIHYQAFMLNQPPPASITATEKFRKTYLKSTTTEEELDETDAIINLMEAILIDNFIRDSEPFALQDMPGLRGFHHPMEQEHHTGICLHSCRDVINAECGAEISRDAPRPEMFKCLQRAGENPQVEIPTECQTTIDEINRRFENEQTHPLLQQNMPAKSPFRGIHMNHNVAMPILKAAPGLYQPSEEKLDPVESGDAKTTTESLIEKLRAHHLLSENEEFYLQVAILTVLTLILFVAMFQLMMHLCKSKESEEDAEYGKMGYSQLS